MFQRLAQLLRREPSPVDAPLYGLDDRQIANLARWFSEDEAADYLRALDTTANLYAETLLSCRDDATVHELRGILIGIRRAASLVDEIKRQNDARRDAERRLTGDPDAAERRTLATFGSPAWGR